MRKNLGTTERVLRLLLGAIAIGVVLSQPQFGVSEGLVAIAGLFLVLNALAARCYLWRWLGIDTRKQKQCGLEQRPD